MAPSFARALGIGMLTLGAHGLLITGQGAEIAHPLDEWELVGSSHDVGTVGGGNGQFMAGIGVGLIATSADGVGWTAAQAASARENDLRDFIHADGRWVAVGEGGVILTSLDGSSWSRQWSGVDGSLQSVAYGNGQYVAVGGPGRRVILTSTNAIHWSVRESSSGLSPLYKVLFAEERFVAVGGAGALLHSRNGREWISVPNLTSDRLSGLAYANGEFVALGREGVFSSSDGRFWRTNMLGDIFQYDLAFGAGRFVAVGNDKRIWTSKNAVDWEFLDIGSPHHLTSVIYHQDRFLVGGKGGTLAVSSDGLSWNLVLSRESAPFQHLAAGNRRLAAFGSESYHGPRVIVSSTTASDWETTLQGRHTLVSLSFAGNQFLAFAHDGANPTRHLVMTSADASDWRIEQTSIRSLPNEVAFGNGLYVGTGSDFFLSRDGRNWTTVNSPLPYFYTPEIAFGNGRFVAVSPGGFAHMSADGTNWTARNLPSPRAYDVASGNGMFVAVGERNRTGVAMSSRDGLAWNLHDLSALSAGLHNVAFGAGHFVAVGAGGAILSSPDGVAWRRHEAGTGLSFTEVAFHEGRFLALSFEGAAFQSKVAPQLTAATHPDGGLDLEVAVPAKSYVLETAADLSEPIWREVGRVTNSSTLRLAEPHAGRGFFRLRVTE